MRKLKDVVKVITTEIRSNSGKVTHSTTEEIREMDTIDNAKRYVWYNTNKDVIQFDYYQDYFYECTLFARPYWGTRYASKKELVTAMMNKGYQVYECENEREMIELLNTPELLHKL